MSMQDRNKTVLITGGAMGLGYAIARKFAAEGARVAIADIDRDKGRETADALPGVIFIEADASDRDSILHMVEETEKRFGTLDVLVNNAGVSKIGESLHVSREDWELSINLMFSGVFYCCQAAGNVMVRQGGGSILNIASIHSTISIPGRLAYGCSKAAVHHMTKVLAAEWAPYRIRVNTISPGAVMTPMTERTIRDGEARLSDYTCRIPLGRLAKPEEIADACVFLASDAAAYITGNNLFVDGGWTSYHWTDLS